MFRCLMVLFASLFCLANTFAQSAIQGVVINEILVDPSGSTHNFDTDGSSGFEANDEFVELYNTTATPVDISGWEIWDQGTGIWFTFPSGSTIAAFGYVVALGGWDVGVPPADYYSAGTSPTTGRMNNTMDNVVILDPGAVPPVYVQAKYNGDATDNPLTYSGFPATAVAAGPVEDFGNDVDGYSVKRTTDGGTTFTTAAPTPKASNGALPVALTSFEARPIKDKSVQILWSTSSEQNNEYFSVEHSLNGKYFQSIGQVKGAGNSIDNKNYELLHDKAVAGTNYYRLKQVDSDGGHEYSWMISVEIKDENQVVILPTITRDYIDVRMNGVNESGNWAIYNLLGKQMLDNSFSSEVNQFRINVDELPKGQYFIAIENGNQVITNSFVKL